MSEKNHGRDEGRLDKEDVKRAEGETGEKVPLVSSEEDAYVPETELTHDEASDEDKLRNDPTAGKSHTE